MKAMQAHIALRTVSCFKERRCKQPRYCLDWAMFQPFRGISTTEKEEALLTLWMVSLQHRVKRMWTALGEEANTVGRAGGRKAFAVASLARKSSPSRDTPWNQVSMIHDFAISDGILQSHCNG